MECHKINGRRQLLMLPLSLLLLQGCDEGATPATADMCQTILWGDRAKDEDKAKVVTTAPADKKLSKKTVMGIVTDGSGNQLSGAVVQLTSSNNKLALTDTTNVAGRFTFADGRLPATVSLRIDKEGYRCFQLGDVPVDGSTETTIQVLTNDKNK